MRHSLFLVYQPTSQTTIKTYDAFYSFTFKCFIASKDFLSLHRCTASSFDLKYIYICINYYLFLYHVVCNSIVLNIEIEYFLLYFCLKMAQMSSFLFSLYFSSIISKNINYWWNGVSLTNYIDVLFICEVETCMKVE